MMATEDNLVRGKKEPEWTQVYLPGDTGMGTSIRYSLVY